MGACFYKSTYSTCRKRIASIFPRNFLPISKFESIKLRYKLSTSSDGMVWLNIAVNMRGMDGAFSDTELGNLEATISNPVINNILYTNFLAICACYTYIKKVYESGNYAGAISILRH